MAGVRAWCLDFEAAHKVPQQETNSRADAASPVDQGVDLGRLSIVGVGAIEARRKPFKTCEKASVRGAGVLGPIE